MSTENGDSGTNAGAGELPLDFNGWMDLSARLLRLEQEERLDILEKRNIAPEDWSRCDEHYCLALTADIAENRMDRAERYGRACAAELERRKKGDADRPAEPTATGEPKATAAPVGEAQTPAPTPSAPAPLQTEAPILQRAPETIPMHMPPAPAFRYTQAPIIERGPEGLAAPVAARPRVDLTTTAPIDMGSLLRAASALPFGDTPSPEFVAQVSAPKEVPQRLDALGATITLSAGVASGSQAVPFVKQPAEPTAGGPPAQSIAVPQMRLQTYASLGAELAVYPEKAAQILPKYGVVSEQVKAALDQEWRARFAASPETLREWHKLFSEFREWLLKQPK
jgi:hypothetical protein